MMVPFPSGLKQLPRENKRLTGEARSLLRVEPWKEAPAHTQNQKGTTVWGNQAAEKPCTLARALLRVSDPQSS